MAVLSLWQDYKLNINSINGSVTRELKQRYKQKVSAQVIWKGFAWSNHFSSRCWFRDVLLTTGHSIRAVARVIVPAETLQELHWIKRLGPQPLGKHLYKHYKPERCLLMSNHLSFTQAIDYLPGIAQAKIKTLSHCAPQSLVQTTSLMRVQAKATHATLDLLLIESFVDQNTPWLLSCAAKPSQLSEPY